MSTAAIEHTNVVPAADESNTALPLRGDTFLGVCEAVGQDLGFHPNWLRVPFAALILWNPTVIIGVYLGLGGVVALSRWLYPAPRPAAKSAPAAAAIEATAVEHRQPEESKELLAA